MIVLSVLCVSIIIGCSDGGDESNSDNNTDSAVVETVPIGENSYKQSLRYGVFPPQDGIILILHGCDGIQAGISQWIRDWIDYLTVNGGFGVIIPDSFADFRPRYLALLHIRIRMKFTIFG